MRRRLVGPLAAALLAATPATVVTSAHAATEEQLVARCAPGLPVVHPGCGQTYPGAAASTGTEDLRGGDRWATAVATAVEGFPEADVVVLVSGEDAHLVDALTAGPLARRLAAPVLLTPQASLPLATTDYLRGTDPEAVLVVGGAGAVSENVLDQVRALGVASVGRVGGDDRYATSRAVAALQPGATHAWVASGESDHLVDALAAAGPAARLAEPLVLVPANGDAAETAALLAAAGTTSTTVVGGTAAVGADVAAAFPQPTRVEGADRWSTATAVAAAAVTRGVPRADVVVTSGEDAHLVDAVAAAPLGRTTLLLGSAGQGADLVRAWLAEGEDRTTFVGAAAAALVCWGVADCTRVASVDVDGDDVLDDVALAGAPDAAEQQLRVRARARDAVLTLAVQTEGAPYGRTWMGAHPVDDRAGAELVVLSQLGAHTLLNSVVTWRDGALVATASPDGLDHWYVDSSAALNQGITCERPGRVVIRTTDRDPADTDRLVGYGQAYESTDGVWAPVGAQTVQALPDPLPAEYAGWHCGDLPRFGL